MANNTNPEGAGGETAILIPVADLPPENLFPDIYENLEESDVVNGIYDEIQNAIESNDPEDLGSILPNVLAEADSGQTSDQEEMDEISEAIERGTEELGITPGIMEEELEEVGITPGIMGEELEEIGLTPGVMEENPISDDAIS